MILLELFHFIIIVNLLLCLIYKLNLITGTYVEKKPQPIQGLVTPSVSGIHRGSWTDPAWVRRDCCIK